MPLWACGALSACASGRASLTFWAGNSRIRTLSAALAAQPSESLRANESLDALLAESAAHALDPLLAALPDLPALAPTTVRSRLTG